MKIYADMYLFHFLREYDSVKKIDLQQGLG